MSAPSHRTPRRRRTTAAASVGTAAALLALASIWLTSNAAFTAQTDNPGNQWKAGSVALHDDDGGSTAMFAVGGVAPGQSGSNCIAVTYDGTVAASVKLYATGYTSTNSLGANLTLTVTQGSGGGFGTCTGFTPDASQPIIFGPASFDSFGAKTTWGTGVGSWAPTGSGQTRTYKVDWSLPSSDTAGQNGQVNLGFTWEAQNS